MKSGAGSDRDGRGLAPDDAGAEPDRRALDDAAPHPDGGRPILDEAAPHQSLWMRRAGGPRILITLALMNLFAYATRNALFAAYGDLRDRFDLVEDAKVGLLTTVFLVPHAIATLPFGWAGDRYDRRRVIAFGMLLASVAGAAGALATNTATFAFSRALVGFGTAAVVPVANSILTQVFEGPHKASRVAIFNLGLLLGGVVGIGTSMVAGFSAVWIIAIPGALLAFYTLTLPTPAHPAPHDRVSLGRYLLDLVDMFVDEGRELLRIRTLRWVMISTTAMAFSAGGYNAWMIDFLQRDKHMSKEAASSLLGIAMVGAVAGVIFGGRLADRLRKRHIAGRIWTIVIGMSCAIPCTAGCVELAPGIPLYIVGVVTLFFFSWYHAPMAVTVDDLAPPDKTVSAQGLVIFTMHLLGTASASYVVGIVSDHSSLYAAMWVLTGALVVAALAMLVATRSFAGDHLRARSGHTAAPSL